MKKNPILFMLVLCSLIAFLAVQTLSQIRRSNQTKTLDGEPLSRMTAEEMKKEAERWLNMTEEERQRELANWRRQRELERQRRPKESAAERAKRLARSKADREKMRKEFQETAARVRREFLREKAVLGVTEEQWQLIKPKLDEMRQLRDQARSTVGASLAGGSSVDGKKAGGPSFQWRIPWKDTLPDQLTEAQRLAQQLLAFLGRESTTPQAFRMKTSALRKARTEEAQIERRLAEVRRELCEILTTRQEAALVLMNKL